MIPLPRLCSIHSSIPSTSPPTYLHTSLSNCLPPAELPPSLNCVQSPRQKDKSTLPSSRPFETTLPSTGELFPPVVFPFQPFLAPLYNTFIHFPVPGHGTAPPVPREKLTFPTRMPKFLTNHATHARQLDRRPVFLDILLAAKPCTAAPLGVRTELGLFPSLAVSNQVVAVVHSVTFAFTYIAPAGIHPCRAGRTLSRRFSLL